MIFLTVLILVVLFTAVYFTFFFAYKCDSEECFLAKQESCKRATYTNEINDVSWFYHIKGKKGNSCKILVKISNINEGTIEQEKLEKKEMNCFLEIGDTTSPEAEIEKCTGGLREDLQEMIIKKLHQYVLDNLGEIGEDFKAI
jgi:hypothetical protein